MCGYFLQDELLVRKWVQHSGFVWDPVLQIVLPSELRQSMLLMISLVVRKTYGRLLRHFFWPCVKMCQLTDKPNQTSKPVALCPVPVANQPFDHLIVDCVGPLPPSRTGATCLLTLKLKCNTKCCTTFKQRGKKQKNRENPSLPRSVYT